MGKEEKKINEENVEENKKEKNTSNKDLEEVKESTDSNEDGVDELHKCQEKVNELENKLKEAEDKYLRVHAEFENIKKRLEREKIQAIEYASEKFAKDLLSSLDTLDMALNSLKVENADPHKLIKQIEEGIELTKKNLLKTFEKHGIKEVETDEFDPNIHDAVMQESSENHADGAIIEVLQKGYKFKDRLLRPAMVKICKK